MKSLILMSLFTGLFSTTAMAAKICKGEVENPSPCGTGKVELILPSIGATLFGPRNYILIYGDTTCWWPAMEISGNIENSNIPNEIILKAENDAKVGTFEGTNLKLDNNPYMGITGGDYQLTCTEI